MPDNKVSAKLEEMDLHENERASSRKPIIWKDISYLTMCLCLAAFGGSFQFGWALGVFNVPSNVEYSNDKILFS